MAILGACPKGKMKVLDTLEIIDSVEQDAQCCTNEVQSGAAYLKFNIAISIHICSIAMKSICVDLRPRVSKTIKVL
jgi:hypothetical protein